VTEGFDSVEPDAASTDGVPASEVTAAEIARLTLYGDAQARKVEELERAVGDLRHAVDARTVIDRAVGMLSERFDVSIADAFELLRAAARNNRREVRALATEITESRGQTPPEITEAVRRSP
jgi:ANTAR domain-containing protein